MTGHYGPKIGILVFRKHLGRYLQNFLVTREIRMQIFTIPEKDQLVEYIKNLIYREQE